MSFWVQLPVRMDSPSDSMSVGTRLVGKMI